jgi:hypothetical protein
VVLGRSLDDVITVFKETRTDFIYQGWMVQHPCPDKCSDLSKRERAQCESSGYSYEYLRDAVSKIHGELPGAIFCGGTQAEFLYPDFAVGGTEEERRDNAWKMALDPAKWGINYSKRDLQCRWAKQQNMIAKAGGCPSEDELKRTMRNYYPDLTNPEFQNIFLDKVYKQIDAGVDAIWLDMLYTQAEALKEFTGDENNPAVQETYNATSLIVDRIHEYGKTKGRRIYVMTWVVVGQETPLVLLHPHTNVDAVMSSPSADEILDSDGKAGQFHEAAWDERVRIVKEKCGSIPIFARIDYGGGGRTPLYAFSQELTPAQQKEFLTKADEFFTKKGILFIYPVHGGDMGMSDVKKLSYGKYNWYDSFAPEFDTYGTIRALAQNKSK